MSVGIYSALAGAKLKEEELEMVAHNLANANTNGYKENRLSFSTVLSRHENAPASNASTASYAVVGEKMIDFSPGPVMDTGSELDVALQGNGFLEVQTDSGTLYTRNGALALNQNGDLITQDGGRVMGLNGPIQLKKSGVVEIAAAGNLTVDKEEQGQIKVVEFDDLKKLEPAGRNFFKAKDGVSPHLSPGTVVHQKKLESSNVNVMQNLMRLIVISREYQSYQKVITSQSKLDQEAVSSIGRVS